VRAVLALLAAMPLLLERGTLHVELGRDANLPCTANAALVRAVKIRLPNVSVVTKGAASGDDLIAALSANQRGWLFEVRRPNGTVAMSRDLYGADCAQIADTVALILDRYLAGISWSSVPRPKPLVVADAGVVATPAPIADAGVDDLILRIGVEPEPPPPTPEPEPIHIEAPKPEPISYPPPFFTSMDVSLGGGLWLLTGALSLDVGIRIRTIFRVSLLFFGTTPLQIPVAVENDPRGTLRTFDLAGFITAGACTYGTLYLCGGALGGVRATNGWASGQRLYSLQGQWLALPELGAYVRGAWNLPARLFLAIDLLAGFPLGVATFRIKGIIDNTTPSFDVVATLRAGVRI
jgi:hypothetical protein